MFSCLLAVAVLLALVASGAALAARGDPEKRINAADQARAKSMLLRKSDLAAGFRSTPASGSDEDFYCEALDESDLTLTGDAESPDFQARNPLLTGGVAVVSSFGQTYESRADADASWRRGTSTAGLNCLREGFRREIRGSGDRLISFGRVAFPRLAERTVAFRLVAITDGLRIQVDLVFHMQSRGHGGVLVASLPLQSQRAELERLGRIVAARMKTAMRGA